MNSKLILGIFILAFFSQGILTCDFLGEIVDGQYCDFDGNYYDLKNQGEDCLNGYECVDGGCTDGICKSLYDDLANRANLVDEIMNAFRGIECNPEEDTYYSCEGTDPYSCGAKGVWEKVDDGTLCLFCGDGTCEIDEACDDCLEDCGECDVSQEVYCGDNICNGGESCSSCKPDCGKCSGRGSSGNDNLGEQIGNIFNPSEEEEEIVYPGQEVVDAEETVCGNGFCDFDENSFICPQDCDEKERSKKGMVFFWFLIIFFASMIGILTFKIIKKGQN